MIKKLLILPILWCLMTFGAFASADEITFLTNWNSYTPNRVYISNSFSLSSSDIVNFSYNFNNPNAKLLLHWPIWNCQIIAVSPSSLRFNNCDLFAWFYDVSFEGYSFDSITISNSFLSLDNSIIVDDSSSTLVPTIPSSFTTWLTNLVSNFWSTIVLRLPTIILVALWITAIFSLFRVIRWYSKSAFRW